MKLNRPCGGVFVMAKDQATLGRYRIKGRPAFASQSSIFACILAPSTGKNNYFKNSIFFYLRIKN
jgi:hypothetical protein